MADTKLSALVSSSSPCTFYYGIDASNNSRKFSDPGFYNVRNYGAVGDGATDDSGAIQSAVDAATAADGGIIFFPPGNYRVQNSIVFDHVSQAHLRIIGSGGAAHASSGDGTIISTTQRIWIFSTDHGPGSDQGGGTPFESIEHICFVNSFGPIVDGSVTSTEPAGGGFGCIYMTAGVSVCYRSCTFELSYGGIALYDTGVCTQVEACQFYGPYAYTHAENSFGLFLVNGRICGGKVQAFGTGISLVAQNGAVGIIENLDIEVCGCAITLSQCQIDLYDQYLATTYTDPDGSVVFARINNIGCESNGDTDSSSVGAVIKLRGDNVYLSNCKLVNIAVSALYGLWVYGCPSVIVNQLKMSDGGGEGFTNGGVGIAAGGGTVGNVEFHQCFITSNIGPAWVLPTSAGWMASLYSGGTSGVIFKGCNTDGAVAFADLPPAAVNPSFGAEMICSNSSSATFGTVIGGTGATKVVARWDGTNWVVA